MPIIAKSLDRIGMDGDSVYIWSGMKANDVGDPLSLSSLVSLHAQITGALGTGKVVLQGTNVEKPADSDWSTLVDRTAFPVEFITAENFKVIDSIPRWVRPLALADAAMSVNVLLMVRKAAQ